MTTKHIFRIMMLLMMILNISVWLFPFQSSAQSWAVYLHARHCLTGHRSHNFQKQLMTSYTPSVFRVSDYTFCVPFRSRSFALPWTTHDHQEFMLWLGTLHNPWLCNWKGTRVAFSLLWLIPCLKYSLSNSAIRKTAVVSTSGVNSWSGVTCKADHANEDVTLAPCEEQQRMSTKLREEKYKKLMEDEGERRWT